MIPLRQKVWWLTSCVAAQLAVLSLWGESLPSPKTIPAQALLTPPAPTPASPVDFFRQLLTLPAGERDTFLTNRPPAVRKRLLAKVADYEALDPNERELRLRATELHWYLMPLLREPADTRATRLELVPEDLQGLVQSRLKEWSVLPPPLQQEFLANERVLHYFTYVDATNSPPLPPGSAAHPLASENDQARWKALPEEEHQRMTAQFNRFFELTPAEKQKTLNTLSAAERRQMEKTLQAFDQLPAAQRRQCVRAFSRLASLTPSARTEFLKNAEHWSQLPPNDRQAWRDLVTHVPQWPPMPPNLILPPVPTPRIPRTHPPGVTPPH